MASNKYVCIHGHFYQPPRENAWLEVIELQESAAPFHDWNERINFECYAPNAAARILDEHQSIRKIANNYTDISFNFGPTLLEWLEQADPDTYSAILAADAQSALANAGHGNALAQAYNHMILPLADELDKVTQVRWGIADFEHRFRRKPEGMWLPETAVDVPTLEVLARFGIRFTILAPRQAKAFRRMGDADWTPLQENVDPRRPYRCNLPSGKTIDLFFYDGQNAKAVAFEGILNDGTAFAKRLCNVFSNDDAPELSHIATDGESYGHHHRFGEMALASCIDYIRSNELATITNYAHFLELYPPQYEVTIHEPSSWSCVHGVERWRSDCGCTTGSRPGWNQAWRAPLRQALDWLRDRLREIFEEKASPLFEDIWEARNDYIDVVLDRSPANIRRFLKQHGKIPLEGRAATTALRMLEMQRHSMLMYTSCAWFFAEVSGIETTQVLQYALRAIRHAHSETGLDLEPEFVEKLKAVPSNIYADGAEVFNKFVLPAEMSLTRVGMHYAASSIFEDYEEKDHFLHYTVHNEVFERVHAGFQRLAFGRTRLVSDLTWSEKSFSFAVLYLGQQNIFGAIHTSLSQSSFENQQKSISEAFRQSNLGDAINLIHDFGPVKFSFRHLFKDEKRKFLHLIMERSLPPVETVIRDYYEDNYQLMMGMQMSNIPVPEGWKSIAQYIVNRDLYLFFRNGSLSIRRLQTLALEFERWQLSLTDPDSISLAAGERIFEELKNVEADLSGLSHLTALINILDSLEKLGIRPELWKSQNLYYQMTEGYRKGQWVYASKEWEETFRKLGQKLNIRLD